MSEITRCHDPFDDSLWGEYARVLLIGTAGCSAAAWLIQSGTQPLALVMVIANLLTMLVATGDRFAGLPRLTLLALSVIGITMMLAAQEDSAVRWNSLTAFSPLVTLGILLLLMLRDGLIAIRARGKGISPGKAVVTTTILATVAYMIVLPSVDALLANFRESPGSYKAVDLTPWEVLRVRSAKMAVFAIFAYTGACLGSFLNVVAASAPRGEPIALRGSACPKCGTRIRRGDNWPIFSYLRLRGRCRDCHALIPTRYLYVELTVLAIFALLFLYQLVTGAANVPGFQHYLHTGILWIILYTKWPVVGIYLFHCLLFSCVLTLALMEQDRLRPPTWMMFVPPIAFTVLVIAFPTMLTVSLVDQTSFQWPSGFPDWLDRTAACAVGALVGMTVGRFARSIRLRGRQSSSSLLPALTLLGIALGWQAVLMIAVIWLAVISTMKAAGGRRLRPRWLTATTLLFVIAMLHHPAWKWLAQRVSF